MTPAELEAKRILTEYERREREIGRELYSPTRPANLFFRQGQERALLRALIRSNALPLAGKRLLEVGCGIGKWLTLFEQFGVERDHMVGIDLDEARIQEAKSRLPGVDLRSGDATALPWPDDTFDLVFQSLVFTSILDDEIRAKVAAEMRRVLSATGVILWYDFTYNNPSNANVRGVRASEVQRLFPDCALDLERVTLAPPITRRLVPVSWLAATGLERLRVFNTHYFGVIRPK